MKQCRQPAYQHGQSLAEYGLIIALVGVFSISTLSFLGDSISDVLTGMASGISGNQGAGAGGNPVNPGSGGGGTGGGGYPNPTPLPGGGTGGGTGDPPTTPPVVGGGCACMTTNGNNL